MSRRLAVGCSVALLLALVHPPGAVAAPVPAVAVAGDIDGDGYGVDDCAPLAPSINPAAPDRPDLDFTDVNCDGIDGDAADAVFVSLAGSDAATGTRANPLASLTAAVTKASAEGKDVYVAGGTYSGTAALADDVGVYGGYAPGTWARSADETTTLQGSPAALAVGDTGVILQLLDLNGQPDGSGNSYGLRAVPEGATASQVLLEQVRVTAANGASGAAGSAGSGGSTGAGLPGGTGGLGSCLAGAPGTSGLPGSGSGATGSSGSPGASGTFSVPAAATWARPSAAPGVQGGPGGGGAGGTGGVGAFDAFLFIPLCGGAGGTGGAGGGGGLPGAGGQAGGGSFAVYTFSSSVVALASALTSGAGGAGGAGGFGGLGGAGGAGGAGLPGTCIFICAGSGLPGATGAAGGAGGRGGGGAGGPSTAVYQGGETSGFTALESTLAPGTGGAGGAGALGSGAAGAAAPVLRATGAPEQSTYDFDGDGTTDPNDDCPADPGAGGCPSSPETTITGGPADGGYVLSDSVSMPFSSTGGSSYTCSLDGGDGFDCTSPHVVTGLTDGTHVFRVWSRSSPTNADPTSAARTFTVPRDSTDLQHSAGWTKKSGAGYFLDTYSTTKRKRSSLSAPVSGITDVALVATKGKGFGTVKVLLDGTLLNKVNTASTRTQKRQLIPVASFEAPRSGTVKVVVVTADKTVRIEGLGLATD
jgi:hypothetical protein